MSALAPAQRTHLAEVLARYEHAPFGQLNATADELRAACRALGWAPGGDPGFGGQDYLPWARGLLGKASA